MKKNIFLCTCLLSIALLAGCNNANPEATGYQFADLFPYNATLETWNPIVGYPTMKEATTAFEVQSTLSEEIWIDKTQYIPLPYLWNQKDTKYSSGWKIQVDKLYFVYVYSCGAVYSSDCKDPPIIFTHDRFLGDVGLYFRPDIAEKGVAAFSFDEYKITKNNSPYKKEDIDKFWNVHTSCEEYDVFGGGWLDASFETMKSYYVELEHREFPELTYQMKFCVWEDRLIIENINTKTLVYVDLADLNP